MEAEPIYTDLFDDVQKLYTQGEYADALYRLRRAEFDNPSDERRAVLWRMRLYSLLNRTDEAVGELEQAVEHGDWFLEDYLLDDPDLRRVQRHPRFQELVEVNAARRSEAQDEVEPLLLELKPSGWQPGGPALIALHGNGSNAHIAAAHWTPAAEAGWLVALPQSMQVSGPDEYVWNERKAAVGQVVENSTALAKRYDLDPGRTVIGGFSMGAQLALYLALSSWVEVKGFLAVAPYLPDARGWAELVKSARKLKLRGVLIVGEEDAVAFDETRVLNKLMRVHGVRCHFEPHPDLGHRFPPDFSTSLHRALDFING